MDIEDNTLWADNVVQLLHTYKITVTVDGAERFTVHKNAAYSSERLVRQFAEQIVRKGIWEGRTLISPYRIISVTYHELFETEKNETTASEQDITS